MDWKIELLSVPVSDIDRSKDFYVSLGFVADHDELVDEKVRFVQLTPPGSACSIMLDKDMGGRMAPGSLEGIQVVVASADAALEQVRAAGVEARGVEEFPWGRFVFFEDPDGNGWALQELPDYSRQR
jgi:catechol 2,3-dioxygenase-like lactoylglutathione lyase family enzyme